MTCFSVKTAHTKIVPKNVHSCGPKYPLLTVTLH